jgi:hypothetical protein
VTDVLLLAVAAAFAAATYGLVALCDRLTGRAR